MKKDEIIDFSPEGISPADCENTLNLLLEAKSLFEYNGHYQIHNDNRLLEGRIRSEELASKWMNKAIRNAKFIGRFPFVRGVFISGSLSKGVMHSDGDIDFFIVTKHNRLWVARALLVLYKRIFLLNSRKAFCINYFKSEYDLKIEDQNKFTAIELATVVPVVGPHTYNNLKISNPWITSFVKGFKQHEIKPSLKKTSLISTIVEYFLNGSIGNALNNRILKFTIKRNQKKYDQLIKRADYEQMFRSDQNTAKVHPDGHQQKVLTLLLEKEQAFFKQYQALEKYA